MARAMLTNDLLHPNLAQLASGLEGHRDYQERWLPRRSARTDLAVRLEGLEHRFPLSLVFPQIPEEVLILRLVLANPLPVPFVKPLYVLRVQC
jgi:hypothetical protein